MSTRQAGAFERINDRITALFTRLEALASRTPLPSVPAHGGIGVSLGERGALTRTREVRSESGVVVRQRIRGRTVFGTRMLLDLPGDEPPVLLFTGNALRRGVSPAQVRRALDSLEEALVALEPQELRRAGKALDRALAANQGSETAAPAPQSDLQDTPAGDGAAAFREQALDSVVPPGAEGEAWPPDFMDEFPQASGASAFLDEPIPPPMLGPGDGSEFEDTDGNYPAPPGP
jgi:hypothetical protein